MKYRKLPDAELAGFSKNLAARLAAHRVGGIDNDLADELAGAIAALNAVFETTIETGVQITALKQSVIADKQAVRDDLESQIATVRQYLAATRAMPMDFELCGFKFPRAGSRIIASDPAAAVVSGVSNGVNRLRFTGNNDHGDVAYEIWRRQGAAEPWGLHATTTRQTFTDTPVTPGQYYEYKVRAVAARSRSNFSNAAVVGSP